MEPQYCFRVSLRTRRHGQVTGTAGSRMVRRALPAIASVAAVAVAGVAVFSFLDPGPLSRHMAWHIALMNIAAPLVAIALTHRYLASAERNVPLWVVSTIQIVLLWAWHAPWALRSVMEFQLPQVLMHGSLFLAALLFWTLLLGLSHKARWQSIFMLLLTGKLACLLGVLLIFAPRLIYPANQHAFSHSAMADLSDQQLAGLLMITACPLSYLIAGVVIAAQMITDLGRRSGASEGRKLSVAG